jgi:hypothetical protein
MVSIRPLLPALYSKLTGGRCLKYVGTEGPEFFHKSKFASPQYSAALYEWLLDQYTRDGQFFVKAADEFRRRTTAEAV